MSYATRENLCWMSCKFHLLCQFKRNIHNVYSLKPTHAYAYKRQTYACVSEPLNYKHVN